MVVRKDGLHNLIDRLQEPYQKTSSDFLQYLIEGITKSQKNGPISQMNVA